MIYYFAYGSNMSMRRLLTERLAPEGVAISARRLGRLDGYELVFNKPSVYFPGAGAGNIQKAATKSVFGTLNALPEAGLQILDRYENVANGGYERMEVVIHDFESAQDISAITYIARNSLGADLRPRKTYLAYLLEGRDVLPADYTAQLARIPVCPEMAEE